MAADANYSDVVLLLPMSGANNGTVFTDYSPSPKTVTRSGDTKTVTAQSKFYGSSGYFDGSGDYLTYAAGQGLDFIGSAFSIQLYTYPTHSTNTGGRRIISAGGGTVAWNSTDGIHWLVQAYGSGAVAFEFWNGSASTGIVSDETITLNAWNHIYVGYANDTAYIAVNGVIKQQSLTMARPSTKPTTAIATIPGENGNSTYAFKGYMQDISLTKDVARYTDTFTPPGKLVGTISGTIYDANGDAAQRTVIAVPRSYPNSRIFTTQSAANGTYSLTVPDVECSRIVLADETTLYNDIVDRVLPG